MKSSTPNLIRRANTERILASLIGNAIKYGTAGGAIKITLKHDRESVHLSVCDDGCGIPQESLPHVFDRFYRVDKSGSRDAGGSGLGLSITKAIVEAHSGSIKVESAEGKGSTFFCFVAEESAGASLCAVIKTDMKTCFENGDR